MILWFNAPCYLPLARPFCSLFTWDLLVVSAAGLRVRRAARLRVQPAGLRRWLRLQPAGPELCRGRIHTARLRSEPAGRPGLACVFPDRICRLLADRRCARVRRADGLQPGLRSAAGGKTVDGGLGEGIENIRCPFALLETKRIETRCISCACAAASVVRFLASFDVVHWKYAMCFSTLRVVWRAKICWYKISQCTEYMIPSVQ